MNQKNLKQQWIDNCLIESDNEIKPGNYIIGFGQITLNYCEEKINREMCKGCHCQIHNNINVSVQGCINFNYACACNKVGYSSEKAIEEQKGPDTKITKTLTCWHGDLKSA